MPHRPRAVGHFFCQVHGDMTMDATVTIRSVDLDGNANSIRWFGTVQTIEDASSEADNMMQFMQPDQIKSVEIHIDYGDQNHDRDQGV